MARIHGRRPRKKETPPKRGSLIVASLAQAAFRRRAMNPIPARPDSNSQAAAGSGTGETFDDVPAHVKAYRAWPCRSTFQARRLLDHPSIRMRSSPAGPLPLNRVVVGLAGVPIGISDGLVSLGSAVPIEEVRGVDVLSTASPCALPGGGHVQPEEKRSQLRGDVYEVTRPTKGGTSVAWRWTMAPRP